MKNQPEIRLHNVDCMQFMRGLPDKAYEWALVDPQYGIGAAKMAFTQARVKPARQKNGSKCMVKTPDYKLKDWDSSPPPQEYFDELRRVSDNQIVFGINYMKWERLGTGRIKWDKRVPDGVSFNRYEYAYCSAIEHEETIEYLWSGMMQGGSIENPTTQRGKKSGNEKRIHPTQKPVILYKILLDRFCVPGDRILDTHGGSMSIAIACYDLGFSLDLCELDRDYFLAGQKRLDDHISKYAPANERPVTSKGEIKLF